MRLFWVLLLCLWPCFVAAQDEEPLRAIYPDIADFYSLATRAEATVTNKTASDFALTRLRDELFDWRERFQDQLSQNEGRLATIDAQLDALGEVETQAVTTRRDALQDLRATLATPDALVAESHARAEGLLSEVDGQIRANDADALMTRGPSPLNPALWGPAIAALVQSVQVMVADVSAGFEVRWSNGSIWTALPLALVYFVAAAVLLAKGRDWAEGLQAQTGETTARWRAVSSFALSLMQIVIPLVGLWALVSGIRILDVAGTRADTMLNAVLAAGAVVIVARWLNTQLFPMGDQSGPLSYDPETRAAIRRAGTVLSIGIAIAFLLDGALEIADAQAVTTTVVVFPVLVVLAWFLLRLGRLLRTPPIDTPAYSGTGGRVRRLIGQLAMLIAVASPVLAAFGYDRAALASFQPTVLTLAVLGGVLVLQRLVYDVYAPTDDAETAGPLMPVLIGFALFLLALPFLALAWGASVADLREIWAQISTGVAWGDTRISPTDFFTFILVFGVGYVLTRFLQATLKQTVLPRTRLDIGGQNAVVAGVGYVGIFLAGLFAITSAGIDLTSLAFVAGALSLGIGFGLQNIVQNFVSGIILLIERPISEGDMIEVGGEMGTVRDISVRSTRIETFDRRDVIVPNADLVSGQVTNWTRGNAAGRLIVPVGVAYGSDVDKVRDILMDVATAHPMALADPAPQVFFLAFGASSLDFEIRIILRDVSWIVVTKSELHFEINKRFAAEGIEIPFPQQDVWFRNAQPQEVEA